MRALLSAGSSRSLWELGFDIRIEAFWEKGMRQVEGFIDALEAAL